MNSKILFLDAILLLKKLIVCPSFSKEERGTADIIQQFFLSKGILTRRLGNNIWVSNFYFDAKKPSILLNSHHDTVKPNSTWTQNPFEVTEIEGKIIGLGSNDAGASLVCLIMAFCTFHKHENLPFNLVLAATAEEEISGKGGIEALLHDAEFPSIDWAIVGEPTDCKMAIAEKGLMVIDAKVIGKAGHAARNEGINAIHIAMEDIRKIHSFEFPKTSDLLGPVKATVTVIQAGKQHNVIPDLCEYTIDCRVNEYYTLTEVLGILQNLVEAKLTPRSLRLNSSHIDGNHVVIKATKLLGISTFGSPTLSDQALMQFPTVKIGPGHSGRSHTADEFILRSEIEQGIQVYIGILSTLK